MLKVHTTDGATTRIDLEDEEQAKAWIRRQGDPVFQAEVSGLTISSKGVQYSLPRPTGFDNVFFLAEEVKPDEEKRSKGGERIVVIVDDVRITMMVHAAQRSARIAITKMGKQKFNPLLP
jgi:hypothetical protein